MNLTLSRHPSILRPCTPTLRLDSRQEGHPFSDFNTNLLKLLILGVKLAHPVSVKKIATRSGSDARLQPRTPPPFLINRVTKVDLFIAAIDRFMVFHFLFILIFEASLLVVFIPTTYFMCWYDSPENGRGVESASRATERYSTSAFESRSSTRS